MPKYFHHFVPLCDIRTQEECDALVDFKEIEFGIEAGGLGLIRLIGKSGHICFIGVTLPNDTAEEDKSRIVQRIVNHMMSVIKLADPTADLIRYKDSFPSLAMATDNYREQIRVLINSSIGYLFDFDMMCAVFNTTADVEKESIISLLAESVAQYTPTHYKILSVIRLLEILYPAHNEKEMALAAFEQDFQNLGISNRLFRNALPELRTRCAHGISQGGAPPFTSQAYQEHPQLLNLLKLLRKVIQEKVGERLGIRIDFDAYSDNEHY